MLLALRNEINLVKKPVINAYFLTDRFVKTFVSLAAHKMKKIIAILLLLILGLSIFGLYPMFKIMQYRVQLEMAIRIHNRIPAKDIHELAFVNNYQPKWIKEGKEFVHNGHYYDVIEKIIRRDSTIFRCLKDTKETRINKRLKRITALNLQHDWQNKDSRKLPTNFYKFQYLHGKIPFEKNCTDIKNVHFLFNQYFNSISLSPPVPPPETSSLA